jgi:hypothetical protein
MEQMQTNTTTSEQLYWPIVVSSKEQSHILIYQMKNRIQDNTICYQT